MSRAAVRLSWGIGDMLNEKTPKGLRELGVKNGWPSDTLQGVFSTGFFHHLVAEVEFEQTHVAMIAAKPEKRFWHRAFPPKLKWATVRWGKIKMKSVDGFRNVTDIEAVCPLQWGLIRLFPDPDAKAVIMVREPG